MKRNHIAIAGILASVLVTVDAAWADTATVIASQAYVDAKVGTKLNSSALNAGTLSTTSTTTVPSEKTVSDAISDALSDAASVDDGTGSNNALNLTSSSTKAPSVRAVQGSILYSGNTASTNTKTANVNVTDIAANSAVFTTNTTVKADGDSYVPTVAAVEARVKAINIPTVPATTDTKSATYDSGAHTLTVASSGDGASTTKTATPKQVANTITDVKSYIDYKDGLKVDANTAITASGTTNKIVQYDAKGLVVAGTTAGALATKDAVGSADITDLSITNDDISNTANIAYTKMNGTLKDVNSDSADATCTAASPCVLTYYKIGSTVYYKWTNLIETDGVTALPAS